MMVFDFRFKTVNDEALLRGVIDFLHKQDLGYPNYDDWVGRAEAELIAGYKKAIAAISDKRVVGDLLWQPHKGLAGAVELKNLRVHPNLRMRDFARFMLKQVEAETRGLYNAIIGDVRADQRETLAFMMTCGYQPIAKTSLYDSNTCDVTVMKVLNKTERELWVPQARRFIEDISL